MLGIALVAVFGLVILAAIVLSRDTRIAHGTHEPIKRRLDTDSQKLFFSKTDDKAFFDGASEDYMEAYRRVRNYHSVC
ncbi:MAG: hypothetical protein ACXACG_00680 [Candidatus Thorarchaeota archaeon]|jgi:hypothetical protein